MDKATRAGLEAVCAVLRQRHPGVRFIPSEAPSPGSTVYRLTNGGAFRRDEESHGLR